MKSRLRSVRFLSPEQGGFTLTELLVSITILVIMIVMIAQVTTSTSKGIGNSGKHMDSDTEARLVFNRMGVDIARMLKRTDVDYTSFKQPAGTLASQYGGTTTPANLQTGTSDQMAFYSETDGAGTVKGGNKATVSLVAYGISSDPYQQSTSRKPLPVLWRAAEALGWDPDATTTPATLSPACLPVTIPMQWPALFTFTAAGSPPYNVPTNTNFTVVGNQVFRMEYTYLLKANTTDSYSAKLSPTPWWDSTMASTPHTSVDGFKDVSAIVVTIAVLNSTSRTIVNDYSQLTNLLPDAKEVAGDAVYKGDVALAWNAVVNSSSFATSAGIPTPAAASIRIYQRYFYLNSLSNQ